MTPTQQTVHDAVTLLDIALVAIRIVALGLVGVGVYGAYLLYRDGREE